MSAALQVLATVAAEIEEHHVAAETLAAEAVAHAVEAGKLLIEVKAALPHGQFGQWIAANVSVSARQAQRYIAAAQGRKPTTIKSDAVSYLPGDVPTPDIEVISDELASLRDENEALRESFAEIAKNAQEAIDDNNSMADVFASDDKLAAAMAKIKQLTELVRVLEERNRGMLNKEAEAIKAAKRWQRKYDALVKGGAHG